MIFCRLDRFTGHWKGPDQPLVIDMGLFGTRAAFVALKQAENRRLAVPDWTSVNQIAEWTIEAMGLDTARVAVSRTGGSRGWPGDVPKVRLDTTRMTALGWTPKLGSDEAVKRSIRETVEQFS